MYRLQVKFLLVLSLISVGTCLKRCPNFPKTNFSVAIELFTRDFWYLTARTEINSNVFSIFKYAINYCHRINLKTRPCDAEKVRVDISCIIDPAIYSNYNNVFLTQVHQNIFTVSGLYQLIEKLLLKNHLTEFFT